MSSNLTPSPTATTPTATTNARIALTTAYKEPRSCESNFNPTSAAWSDDDSSAVVPVLVSDQVSPCYPSGWDDSPDKSYLSFSPAVCPSGWVYIQRGRTTHSSSVASTAFCCKYGYQFRSFEEQEQLVSSLVRHQCERWVNNTRDYDETATTKRLNAQPYESGFPSNGTLMVHQAWAITWDASDRSNLSPEPLTLTSLEQSPTAATGEGENKSMTAYGRALMIGIPVLVGSILICCCGLIVHNRRKMRKRGQEVALEFLPPQTTSNGDSGAKTS